MKNICKFLAACTLLCSVSAPRMIHCLPNFSVSAINMQNNISGSTSEGFIWSLDTTSKTLTIEGKGTLNVGANCEWRQYDEEIDTVVLGNGITDIMYNTLGVDIDTLVLGDTFNTYHEAGYTPGTAFSVSSQNQYFTTYDGALYSKDGKTLIRVPSERHQITIRPDVEVIANYAFWSSKADSVILPEGTKIVEPTAFYLMEGDGFIPVVLPDSLQTIELDKTVSSNNNVQFIFSDTNAAAKNVFSYQYGAYNLVKAWEKLHYYSVEEIYEGATTATYGWKSICGNLFFVTEEGCAETGWIYDQGKYYYYDRSEMKIVTSQTNDPTSNKSGLQYVDGKVYYYENSIMQKSKWVLADGNWYYLNDYGAGVVNCWRLKDGKYVYLGSDGKMKTNCWIEYYNDWYYVKADGTRYESTWAKIGGSWYWFGGSGKMMSNGWLKLADGKWYYFRSGGQMATGWIKDGSKWYYLTGSGAMATNKWAKSSCYWYYLGSNGAMLTNTITPDGYHVDSNGRWG